ncbi:villin-1 isoform X1 [Syngnathus acus]|uniref:villin-1 isoform X1 n=2 Tax=Syngnathus acus TaxID=161584 RepID=UPI0018864BB3|nr:villin-1 isoform X1 [Syngnathus acus]
MMTRTESSKDKPTTKSTVHVMMNDANKDAFRSVHRKAGLQIWTINKLQMVPLSAQSFGNFFEGDCYIVLHMSQNLGSADIHYWIGNTSSQDEQGAAAVFVTQLDEHLGGAPVQHREVQGHESPRFRGYFKNGIIYKKGGVASGFDHVDTNAYNVLRLLHVKGRKHITATEVDVAWSSFNTGDIFLLDMGNLIVQWNGEKSNRGEKLKATLLAQDIRDRERGGRAAIGVVEGGDERDSPELMKNMTAALGPRTGALKAAIPDDDSRRPVNANVRLYHVYDVSGNLVVQEVATQPLTQNLLKSSDCYILDNAGSSVMVWKGKHASKEEKRGALNRAVGYIKAKNYPASTSVEVMCEGGESAMFKHLFKEWRDKNQTQGLGTTHNVGKIAKVDQVKFDVMELHARPEVAAKQRMVDDGSGDVKVWRIEDLELAEVNPRTYGQFYGGDCYLVLYTYRISNREQHILYMWQGRSATKDEVTACAYQAVLVDQKYNGAPVQVRVVMGKEPRHFLAIFKGRLIIFEGGTGRPGVVNPVSGARLFQVRGTSELNTKATEVLARASSLNTNDVFLLKSDHSCYLWYGKGCSGDERVMARAISDVVSKQDKQVVMEGQEPAEFWVALGGKAPYANDKSLQREEPLHSPRLFECSNQTGQFRMTEVDDFAQSDLDEEDVMLLDTWEEIFLWVGNSANEYETKETWNSAHEYLRTHPAGRDKDTPVVCVKQGFEPPTFTGWFNAWDPHKWSVGKSYEEIKKELNSNASLLELNYDLNNTTLNSGGGNYRAPGGPMSPPIYKSHFGDSSPVITSPTSSRPFPTAPGMQVAPELLINKSASELPPDVDPCYKENFLSDADFEQLLGMGRLEFQRLAEWRQKELKKKAGLF